MKPVMVCVECGRLEEGSWPKNYALTHRGPVCVWCLFPGQYDTNGNWIGRDREAPLSVSSTAPDDA